MQLIVSSQSIHHHIVSYNVNI